MGPACVCVGGGGEGLWGGGREGPGGRPVWVWGGG